MRTCLASLLVFLATGACQSSAPYTLPSAAINTAIAAGFAARERAQGGCYAVCVNGTVCNAQTGMCDRPCDGACSAYDICTLDENNHPHCVPTAPAVVTERQRPPPPSSGLTPTLGVSPLTGTAPALPPEKASPEKP